MRRQPERRHGRSDDQLRTQRDEQKRQWEAQHGGLSETDRRPADELEATMAKTQRRRMDNLVAMPSVNQRDVTASDIARRAYELYEQRGGEHGHDLGDWLQAEPELRAGVTSTAA